MTDAVFVIGAGGHAKVVVDVLQHQHCESIEIFDAQPVEDGEAIFGCPVFNISMLEERRSCYKDVKFVIAIGNVKHRVHNFKNLKSSGLFGFEAVHPSAVTGHSVTVGESTVIFANAVINPHTMIGSNVIINTAAVVEHDNQIKDHAHIGPNATLCGGVSLGKYSFVGAGAVVLPGISIGQNVTVGAGSVVTKNVPDNTVVAGNPAKKIKENEDATLAPL